MSTDETKSIQTNDRADIQIDPETTACVVESLVLRGDISGLNPKQKAQYYIQTCKSLGLNPATRPFAILRLNGKEIMYPERNATDQLAAIHRLNREIVEGPKVIDLAGTKLLYAVCKATHPNGRIETAVATVPLNDPMNAMMKVETKAKRRATLSILSLGMLDETEIEAIPASAKTPAPAIHITQVEFAETDAPSAAENISKTPAFDALQDDLRPLEDSTLLKVARVWRKHIQRIGVEAGGDAKYLYDAQQLALGSTKVGCTRNQLNEHVAALEMQDQIPNDGAYSGVMDQLERAETADGVVEVWKTNKAAVDQKPEEIQSLLRKLATRRVQELIPGMADARQAAQWLKNALSTKDAGPSDSGDDPERDAIAAEGNGEPVVLTIEEWHARAKTKRNEFELARSFLKREREFKRAGINEKCLALTVELLMPLLGTDSHNDAIAFIRNQAAKQRA